MAQVVEVNALTASEAVRNPSETVVFSGTLLRQRMVPPFSLRESQHPKRRPSCRLHTDPQVLNHFWDLAAVDEVGMVSLD